MPREAFRSRRVQYAVLALVNLVSIGLGASVTELALRHRGLRGYARTYPGGAVRDGPPAW